MLFKSSKKSMAVLLVLVLVLSVACAKTDTGSGADQSNEDTSTGNETAATTEDTSEKTEEAETTEEKGRETISVMGVDWGYGPMQNSDMEIYWEDMYDVNLDIEWVNYSDYQQKSNTLVSTGSQPDVMQVYKTNSSFYYPIFTQAIDAGEFLDLTPYLFDGGNGLAETNAVMKNWDESMWEQASYKGGIYILPRSKGEIAVQSGITVRKDLMKKYGYEEEPTTMEELKDWMIGLSKDASEGEGQKIYALDFYGEDFMQDRVKGFAVAFTGQMDWGLDANGDFTYMQFADGYLDFLNWMKDLYEEGVLDPEFSLGNSDTSKWKAGNSVAYLTAWYNWNQSADLTSNKIFDSGTPDTYEAWCLLPVEGPKGMTVSNNAYDIDSCITISSSVTDDELAAILKAFNGTEEEYPGYNVLMSNGVEGVHYKLLEDGTFDTSDEVMGEKRREGYVGAWNQIFLKTDADQIVGKFMRAGAKRASDENIERATEIKAAIVDYLDESGLQHMSTNLISETYNNQWSVLTSDVNTYCTLYVMGQITEADWNEFVASIVDSSEYKAIQAEFAEALANK